MAIAKQLGIQKRKEFRGLLKSYYHNVKPPRHDWYDEDSGKGLKHQRLQDFQYSQASIPYKKMSADLMGEQYDSIGSLDKINWDDKFQMSTESEHDITGIDQQIKKQDLMGRQNEKQMNIIMKSEQDENKVSASQLGDQTLQSEQIKQREKQIEQNQAGLV